MGSASALASAVLLCEKAFRGHGLIQLKLALSCDLGKGKIFAYLNFVFVVKRNLNFDDLASFFYQNQTANICHGFVWLFFNGFYAKMTRVSLKVDGAKRVNLLHDIHC